jgi:hypothetical protein
MQFLMTQLVRIQLPEKETKLTDIFLMEMDFNEMFAETFTWAEQAAIEKNFQYYREKVLTDDMEMEVKKILSIPFMCLITEFNETIQQQIFEYFAGYLAASLKTEAIKIQPQRETDCNIQLVKTQAEVDAERKAANQAGH